MLFRLYGINLPRDAYQQKELGTEVEFHDTIPGDVAFFSNSKGKIIHVGLIIEDKQIIHASGRVRIDELTSNCIYNKDYQKETHNLCVIKRIV